MPMKHCAFIILIFLMTQIVPSRVSAQEIPVSISSALYQITNEGADTIVVYLPSFNDQLPATERELLPFYVFWRLQGHYYYRKYARGVPEGNTPELTDSSIADLAAEHFSEIENEEIIEPYYRQIQHGDTVWIMFPPSGSNLKDVFLIQTDGLRIVKFIENSSLDAKEYFADDIYNIHYTVNAGLFTAILRKRIQSVIADLEKQERIRLKQ